MSLKMSVLFAEIADIEVTVSSLYFKIWIINNYIVFINYDKCLSKEMLNYVQDF